MTIDTAGNVGARTDSGRWPSVHRVPGGSSGGRVASQAMTILHDRMRQSRNTYTWIQNYDFSGGLISSVEAVVGITERETLRLWHDRFNERRQSLSALGFDNVFQRMWELYRACSEAGFRFGYLDVYQWAFAPTGNPVMETP